MDTINISVSNQKLRVATNLKKLVAGSQEFVKFSFELGAEWDGLTSFAQFKQGENTYNQLLDNENCCYLPVEIEPGECTLMLYGAGGNSVGVTDYLTFSISDNILLYDEESGVTPSLYQQLSDRIQELENPQPSTIEATFDSDDNTLVLEPTGNASINFGGDVLRMEDTNTEEPMFNELTYTLDF